ncbi:MAG TPA: citrate/2-methylcitrate synthase [Labilithrix sp.]|nr:citrate/2-methylcitrate synthase [Labilithrix sp.]
MGIAVEELAGRVTFEDAIHLLWRGREPSGDEREHVRALLGEAREAAVERLSGLGDALALPDAMDSLRAAVGHLGADADEGGTREPDDDGLASVVRIVGALAVMAAAWARKPAPVRPDPGASHAADYLRMATGRAPSQHDVNALDAYLVTVIDHGMNASTFAARVVASTGSDTVSAIVAAIGALKGKLHGGAPERALRANVEFYTAVLLEAVGLPRPLFTPTFAVARAAGWCAHIEEERAAGRLIRPKSRYVDAPPLAYRGSALRSREARTH